MWTYKISTFTLNLDNHQTL